MSALINHSQSLAGKQTMQKALHDLSFEGAEEIRSDTKSNSMPARGIILGVFGGIVMWGGIIMAVSKLL